MMKLIKGMLINLVLLMVMSAPEVRAFSEGRLLGLSQSGNTALFNLGVQDGMKEGDFGVVVKQVRDLNTQGLRLYPVAKAKNVKVSPDRSVWVLFKVYDPKMLVNGDPYLLFSETQVLSGRRDPTIGRVTVVTEKGKTAKEVKETLSGGKDAIAKLKNEYPAVTPIHSKEDRQSHEVELVDVEQWKKIKNDKYRTALYKSPYQDDFQREFKISTFEKLVTAYLKRVNDPTFSYDKFYDEQKKMAFSNEFRERSNFSTEYESFVATQASKARENAKLYRSILEKGETWSEDFSTEELRTVLKEVSVLQEKDRRLEVMTEPHQYALLVNYGLNLNDPQTEKDVGYRRDSRFSLDVDFEGVPFIKHETLERFTLNATLRSNKTATDADGLNASIDELSATVGVNWYPMYASYAVEAPAFFIGTYIRSGSASVESPSAGEKGTYTVLSMPGFRGGMRYNFKNNFGLRIAISMETLQLDRYQQNKVAPLLPDQMDVVEGKMNFAVAYSF